MMMRIRYRMGRLWIGIKGIIDNYVPLSCGTLI